MRKSVAWMANNHVAANLLMIFVLLSGFIAMMGLKRETFPEFSLDQVQVQVPLVLHRIQIVLELIARSSLSCLPRY